MTFRLPPAIHYFTNKIWYLVLWLPYIALYELINRFPFAQPRELTFSALDTAVPFVPEFLVIYIGYLPFYWWSVSRSENDLAASRVFYATHLQLLISLPFFLFLPVTLSRDLFYGSGAYNWAGSFWLWFDGPNNCFPSLHVSNCLMLTYFNWRRPFRWVTAAAALAIIASTVLVKQHYVVDIAGGVAVFAVSLWFLKRLRITNVSADGWILVDDSAPREGVGAAQD